MAASIGLAPFAQASDGIGAHSQCDAHPSNAISRPSTELPPQSCDCHVHVFDPARFSYTPTRSYTPSPATVADLLCFERTLGVERMVIVQPSVYGTDNSCLVDALKKIGPANARGVAVVDLKNVKEAELDHLHAYGVRGIRLNLEVKGESRYDAALEQLRLAEQLLASRKWTVQIYADLALVLELQHVLPALKIRVMLDHFSGAKVAKDTVRDYKTLRTLAESGNVFIKLSAPYRASTQAPGYADMREIVEVLVGADAKGLVWATDWPHTGSSGTRSGDLTKVEPFRRENDGKTVDVLSGWIPSAQLRKRILVDNPADFYGF